MFGAFGFGQAGFGQGPLGGTSPIVFVFDGVIIATLTFAGNVYSTDNLNAMRTTTSVTNVGTTTNLMDVYTTTDANDDYSVTFKE